MITFAGLDVSQARTAVCIIDERGCVTWRGSCATSPGAIAQTLATRASSLERVGLESGPLAPWLVHELRALELPMVCLDARHARAALSVQINKSDANDADGIVRATLGVRKQLVGMRTEVINQIRGLMKIFGLIQPKGSGARFEASVRARLAEHAELGLVIEPLLAAWRAVDDQVEALERQLVRRARRHEVCHRLMTVPRVGPLTALAFVTTVDDPARFRRSSSVGAYLAEHAAARQRHGSQVWSEARHDLMRQPRKQPISRLEPRTVQYCERAPCHCPSQSAHLTGSGGAPS
jgi:transposase